MENNRKIASGAQQGISLLEVLVVIVLTGLISTMLLQGITFSLAAFEKNRNFQRAYQKDILAHRWLRDSVENMMASHDSEFSLVGTNKMLKGYSLAPIFREAGELVKAKWFLDENGGAQELWYEEGNRNAMLIATWQAESARFSYGDFSGNEHDGWPAIKDEQGQIPVRIKLIFDDDLPEARRVIWMSSMIRRQAAFDYRDAI